MYDLIMYDLAKTAHNATFIQILGRSLKSLVTCENKIGYVHGKDNQNVILSLDATLRYPLTNLLINLLDNPFKMEV